MSPAEPALVELGRLSDDQVAELEAGEDNPFDIDGRLSWRDKDRHVALVERADGRLLAVAGLVIAAVSVADGPRFEVAGIGGVIVRADRRGEGLARRVVGAALGRATAMGPGLALLFCRSDRAGLYARLGFARVEAPVTVAQPAGPTVIPLDTMWRALHPGRQWPAGPVRLPDLPF